MPRQNHNEGSGPALGILSCDDSVSQRRLQALRVLVAVASCWVFPGFFLSPVLAQAMVPPQAIAQFQQVVGNRAEAAIILGGDYGAAGGIYTFRGGKVAELSVAKLGGGGDVAPPRACGVGDVRGGR